VAHVNSSWIQFLSQLGNKPGAQQGDVVVELTAPVAGMHAITCPSIELSLALEAGAFLGAHVVLGDGRKLFVPAANIAGIIDAPPGGAPEAKTPALRPSASRRTAGK
jgi:hypothetical protein